MALHLLQFSVLIHQGKTHGIVALIISWIQFQTKAFNFSRSTSRNILWLNNEENAIRLLTHITTFIMWVKKSSLVDFKAEHLIMVSPIPWLRFKARMSRN